jgi:hypothetical protein
MKVMKCWICGSPDADSYEHIIKASDLRSLFGQVSQNNFICANSNSLKNSPLTSIKKPKSLKFKKPICSNCNNNLTSEHDKAWQHLSEYLRFRGPEIKPTDYVRLNKIFARESKKKMLLAHLYFVKLFGCAINDYDIQIDLSNFSKSILNNSAHPNVYILFSISNYLCKFNMAGPSDIQCVIENDRVVYAHWMYSVGAINLTITYAEDEQKNRMGLINSWSPKMNTKRIYISDFDDTKN